MHAEHPMRDGNPPEWADGYGFDEYGPFADVYVGEATLRMRWIPPGTFMMGSPEDEAGRNEGEPQHQVSIMLGYWLADSPTTQSLWAAVMHRTSARFKHPERPVEQVSWLDVQAFIVRLNETVPLLNARLPTEAQWEHACRAGTTTATYADDLATADAMRDPVLDPIAWYSGNGGIDFDLEAAYAVSDIKDLPFEGSGTRIIKQKAPNAWGLYDTLGNVLEWCADDVVQLNGLRWRRCRGGSWSHHLSRIRAASRDLIPESERDHAVGFRLAAHASSVCHLSQSADFSRSQQPENPRPLMNAPHFRDFEGLPEKSQQFITLVAVRGILARDEALEVLDLRRPKSLGGVTEPIYRRCRDLGIALPYLLGRRDGKRVWLWPGYAVPDDVELA